MPQKPQPRNPKLYLKVKEEAKKKFKSWPSVYGSSWLVREYKKRGGTYRGERSLGGLPRWFQEEWINVCKLPREVACGRPKGPLGQWKKTYPYCRPKIRVSPQTPVIAGKLTKAQIRRRCAQKKKNPLRKIRQVPKKK